MTNIPLNTLIQWTEEDRECGECPVPAGSDVTVYFIDGFHDRGNTPEDWEWGAEFIWENVEIIGYKVHSMPQQPREWWIDPDDGMRGFTAVTRVEVIDQNGRAYIATDAKGVTLALQDDERTLKLFVAQTTTLTRQNV